MLKNKLSVAVSLSVLGIMFLSPLQAMERDDELSAVLITINVGKPTKLEYLRNKRYTPST